MKNREDRLKLALVYACRDNGENSAAAGLILLDLIDLYESQQRESEAEPLWYWVRLIFQQYHERLAG
jgi:hypothetical protein